MHVLVLFLLVLINMHGENNIKPDWYPLFIGLFNHTCVLFWQSLTISVHSFFSGKEHISEICLFDLFKLLFIAFCRLQFDNTVSCSVIYSAPLMNRSKISCETFVFSFTVTTLCSKIRSCRSKTKPCMYCSCFSWSDCTQVSSFK